MSRFPRDYKLFRRQDGVRQRKKHGADHNRLVVHRQHGQHHGQDGRRVDENGRPQRGRHARHQHDRHARPQQHHGARDALPPGLGPDLRLAGAQAGKQRDVEEVRDEEAAEAAEEVELAGPCEERVAQRAERQRGHEERRAAGAQGGEAREQRRRRRLVHHARLARGGADVDEV
ncbi:hypothetical protein PWT90_01688 [Aphanocladium album]|nr:hypothetical protein PWT90_01688 [Aphanocladium album]